MNNWSRTKRLVVIFGVIALGIILDQLSKLLFENLEKAGSLPIFLVGEIGFVWTINYGGAWSILTGKSVVFFIITMIGIPLFAVLLYVSRNKSPLSLIGYSCIITGTLGNALDRLFRATEFFNGGVRDFLSIGSWFPVFNVADMFLTFGVAFVILSLLFFDDDSIVPHKKKEVQIEN